MTILLLSGLLFLTACAEEEAPDAETPADSADDSAETGDSDGTDDDEGADDNDSSEGDGSEAEGVSTVAVSTTDLGDILVDGEGRTLYAFVPDDQSDPTCTDDCAANWPPLEGPASADASEVSVLLGTADHPNGTTMVTYNSWPLYHFAADESPGDTNGQGVGDSWYVVSVDGELVRE